ncbi:MAG: hypothetical protein JW839_17580 [Candidatus Lokiarchaeota archaeon]|nr:hypothetical protein [Candidatus Lokiarchaeota archaeon]
MLILKSNNVGSIREFRFYEALQSLEYLDLSKNAAQSINFEDISDRARLTHLILKESEL